MLAMWFEVYAQVMEINNWTSTEFTRGERDDQARRWNATLKLADGSERVLRPRHIVFVNGASATAPVGRATRSTRRTR
jgi:putative flavoprotein involved in K+ transport